MISIKELINIPYRCIQETFDYEYYILFSILQDYNQYLQFHCSDLFLSSGFAGSNPNLSCL